MNQLLRPLQRLLIIELLLVVGVLFMLMHCAECVYNTLMGGIACIGARLFPPENMGSPALRKIPVNATESYPG